MEASSPWAAVSVQCCRAQDRFCEGFQMPAHNDGPAQMGAGVGKPTGKEPARSGWRSGGKRYGFLWVVPGMSVATCDWVVRR